MVGRCRVLFTDEQLTVLTELYEKGLSDPEIAEELGVKRQAVKYRRKRLGLLRSRLFTDQELVDLHQEGYNDREMAERLGASEEVVFYHRSRLELEANRYKNQHKPFTDRLVALAVMSRRIVIMIYSWLSIIGLCIVYRGIPPLILAVKLFLAMTGTALGTYLWNDVCDFTQDTSGEGIEDFAPSGRPLGRGLVSKRRMGVFSALLVVLGLTASALINLEVLLIQSAFLVLFFFYSTEPIR
ncbi:unnamed protein product, partial [marine sediment metagenome]